MLTSRERASLANRLLGNDCSRFHNLRPSDRENPTHMHRLRLRRQCPAAAVPASHASQGPPRSDDPSAAWRGAAGMNALRPWAVSLT